MCIKHHTHCSVESVTDTCDVQVRQPVNLFTTLKTVKGLLYLVPPRTSRIGATVRDYLAHTAAKLPLLKI